MSTRLALEPLFTNSALRAPTYFAKLRSNSAVNCPAVDQPSRMESTKAHKPLEFRTFPETGTTDSPGINSLLCRYFSVNASVASSAV